jgi:Domain of unknown function (DUF4224)
MTHKLLTAEELEAITGKKRYSTQVAWFKQNFAVEPVCRPDGSILMTQAAFEALLLKRMGVASSETANHQGERPPVYPLFGKR